MRCALLLLLMLMPQAAAAAEVQEVVSRRGVTAWLVEDHSLPLLAVKVTFRDSGTAYDPAGKEGRASMAAAMLMEGAGDMNATAFSRALERDAIELGFGVDEDGFNASLNSISDAIPQAFTCLGLALNRPRLDGDALIRVRRQMLTALAQQEKDPHAQLQRRWDTLLFAKHPYANPPLGTRDSVKRLTAADVKQYLRGYLTRDRLVVAVVGDITPEALRPLLDAHLATLPALARPDVTVAEATLPETAQQAVVESDIPQTLALFGAQGVKRDDPAFYDAYVMNYLLGGGALNSRLFSEIREKRGLTYGISTGLTPLRHAAVWAGSFATRNDKAGEALTALRALLADFAAKGPTEEELAQAKQYLTGSFVLGLDSNHEIAHYLIMMQVHQLGRDYLEKRNALMESVTREGVQAVAARVVDPKGLQVVLAGRPVLASGGRAAP